jgi:hypothetical protein
MKMTTIRDSDSEETRMYWFKKDAAEYINANFEEFFGNMSKFSDKIDSLIQSMNNSIDEIKKDKDLLFSYRKSYHDDVMEMIDLLNDYRRDVVSSDTHYPQTFVLRMKEVDSFNKKFEERKLNFFNHRYSYLFSDY